MLRVTCRFRQGYSNFAVCELVALLNEGRGAFD